MGIFEFGFFCKVVKWVGKILEEKGLFEEREEQGKREKERERFVA